MPVNPTYPGVYIEEIPSGVCTITDLRRVAAGQVDPREDRSRRAGIRAAPIEELHFRGNHPYG